MIICHNVKPRGSSSPHKWLFSKQQLNAPLAKMDIRLSDQVGFIVF